MTLDNHTDPTDPVDPTDPEESGVFKALRQQVKDQKKELDAAPDRTELEVEIRATLKHESAIEAELIGLGHPIGIRELVDEKLGENEVTKETVTEALIAIGYKVDETDGATEESNKDTTKSGLAEVSNLSSAVQSAAQNKPSDDLAEKIASANTPEALAKVMAEAEQTQ